MRYPLITAIATLFIVAPSSRAQDDPRAILARAVKAHGGAEALARFPARHLKIRGTLSARGDLPFLHELYFQAPGRMRDLLTVEAAGKKTTILYGLDGDKGWLQIDGQTQPLPDAMLVELREAAHLVRVCGLSGVLGADYQATPLPAADVAGRPALGIRLSTKGYRDVALYFDKEWGLLVKAEHAVLDSTRKQMVKEERLFSGWKEVSGLRTPTHVEVVRDGKKFMVSDVTELQLLDKLEDRWFARP